MDVFQQPDTVPGSWYTLLLCAGQSVLFQPEHPDASSPRYSMSALGDTTFIVTDVETTGRSATANRITEVASVWVADGEIVDERSTLVNPEQYIPHEIQQMTGITNAMVLEAPDGKEVFPEVRRWFSGDGVFTAHNAKFDYNFLQQSFHRYDISGLEPRTLCTLRLSRRLLPSHRGFALHKLASYFGIRIRNRHRALGDSYATAKILIALLNMAEEEHGCETLDELLRLQFRPTTAFRNTPQKLSKHHAFVQELPHRPGVYKMLGRGNQLLYVGKAKNLRDRVGSYFRPGADHAKKIREMMRRLQRVEVVETGSELGALLLESRLIKEHQPKYNTAGKRLRRYGFVRLDLTNAFPRVEYAPAVLEDGAEYYGPFRNRDAAQMLVEAVDHLFKLRECKETLHPHKDAVPCFYHQIYRCYAPCALQQTQLEYREEVERVRGALSSSEDGIIGLLGERMERHAMNLEFEEAAALRDRIAELRRVFVWKRRVAESINTNNLLIVLPAPDPKYHEVFLIRFGRLAEQMIVGQRFPEVTLRRMLQNVFFNGESQPPQFDRIEIDEIRIIAGYLRHRSEKGTIVHIRGQDTLDSILQKVKESGELQKSG